MTGRAILPQGFKEPKYFSSQRSSTSNPSVSEPPAIKKQRTVQHQPPQQSPVRNKSPPRPPHPEQSNTEEQSQPLSSNPRKATLDLDIDPNEPTYCICKQVSFGEMIACDNDDCPLEWFHYNCVGLTGPVKGKWFCPMCAV